MGFVQKITAKNKNEFEIVTKSVYDNGVKEEKFIVDKNKIEKIEVKEDKGKYIIEIKEKDNSYKLLTGNKNLLVKVISSLSEDIELKLPEVKLPTYIEKNTYDPDDKHMIYYQIGFIGKDKIYTPINLEKRTKISTRTFRESYYFQTHYIKNLKETLEKIFKINTAKIRLSQDDVHFKIGSNFNILELEKKLKEESIFAALKKKTGLNFGFDKNNLIELDFTRDIKNIITQLNKYVKKLSPEIIKINKKDLNEMQKIKSKIHLSDEIIQEMKLNPKYDNEMSNKILLNTQIILSLNSKLGKETITEDILDKSGFVKKLKQLENKNKELAKILKSKTVVKGKFISSNIREFTESLNNFNYLKIDKEYLTFNSKNNHMEFQLKEKNSFQSLLEKTKNDIKNIEIINNNTKNKILNKINEFEELLNNFIDKNYNISIIKKILNSKTAIKKYPVLNDIKEWLKIKLAEYKEYINLEKSAKLKFTIK